MNMASPARRPVRAALSQRTGKAMDVILHIGAHRCASTTFQHYMRLNAERLSQDGVGFWGPRRTRTGLFRGLLPAPDAGRDRHRRAIGRVQMHVTRSRALGLKSLVVSDENMLGSVRENLRLGTLYRGVGERMSRYFQAFDGHVSDVILNIRSPESYWASALGYGLTRGRGVPVRADLDRLLSDTRSWRDVITDVACATPGARLWVLPFETFAGRPETQLGAVTGIEAPKTHARGWCNATPRLPELRDIVGPQAADALHQGDGRWQPFDAAQKAALRERYAEDVMWMTAGAEGLAWWMNDPEKRWAGPNLPPTDMTRGIRNDHEERRMARAR